MRNLCVVAVSKPVLFSARDNLPLTVSNTPPIFFYRTIPPLKHEVVHDLKRNFPDMHIVLNGGLNTLDEAASHLDAGWRCPASPENMFPAVDGVMVGRAAYNNPLMFQDADRYNILAQLMTIRVYRRAN